MKRSDSSVVKDLPGHTSFAPAGVRFKIKVLLSFML